MKGLTGALLLITSLLAGVLAGMDQAGVGWNILLGVMIAFGILLLIVGLLDD